MQMNWNHNEIPLHTYWDLQKCKCLPIPRVIADIEKLSYTGIEGNSLAYSRRAEIRIFYKAEFWILDTPYKKALM